MARSNDPGRRGSQDPSALQRSGQPQHNAPYGQGTQQGQHPAQAGQSQWPADQHGQNQHYADTYGQGYSHPQNAGGQSYPQSGPAPTDYHYPQGHGGAAGASHGNHQIAQGGAAGSGSGQSQQLATYAPPARDLGSFQPSAQQQPQAHNTAGRQGLHGSQYDDYPSTQPPYDAHGYDAGGFGGAAQQDAAQNYAAYGTQPQLGYDPATGQYADAGHQYGGYEAGADHGQGYEGDEYDDGDDYDNRGSSRSLLIVGALVGAIVVGGGLAYGYQVLIGPSGKSADGTPLVLSAGNPLKSRPTDAGGRKFDHTKKKILGRLGEVGGGASSEGSGSDGARRVSTVTVGSDGRIRADGGAPGVTVAGSAAASDEPTVSVPGLTVVDVFGNQGVPVEAPTETAATAKAPAAGAQQPLVIRPPPKASAPAKTAGGQKPIVISKATPSGTADGVAKKPVTPPAKAGAASVKPVAKPKKPAAPAAKKKVVAKAPVSPPPAASSGGNGYVAVLASVPVSSSSRMDALKQFADIQQRYSSVLQNKTPDVKEANLGAKGKYHRLMVGPPGSRTQASDLCVKLKTAGYSGCWVTAY